jgi:hypothetical protein
MTQEQARVAIRNLEVRVEKVKKEASLAELGRPVPVPFTFFNDDSDPRVQANRIKRRAKDRWAVSAGLMPRTFSEANRAAFNVGMDDMRRAGYKAETSESTFDSPDERIEVQSITWIFSTDGTTVTNDNQILRVTPISEATRQEIVNRVAKKIDEEIGVIVRRARPAEPGEEI